MVEEEKSKVNSVLVKEDDVVIKKEFSQKYFEIA
jgi:GR25 family glycosyltransferase involved in LPS biosynthesis